MPIIGIVAGEASGDLLGSHLIQALKRHRSDLQFVGIAGPQMIREGAQTLVPMEKLSVRGYVEVIKHLPALLGIRRQVYQHLLQVKPDVFISIDAPDFNLTLARKLKRRGITTIHYVSPSIWAWRKSRVSGIKRAVTHMLNLFPFENPIYESAQIPCTYVGHPLADALPLVPDVQRVRAQLRIQTKRIVIALLPGSRVSELEQHAKLMVETARIITKAYVHDMDALVFLMPLITRTTRKMVETVIYEEQQKHTEDTPMLPIQLMYGHAHMAMEAADVVVVASGTATLEAALLKKPMVITYKMPWLSWQILKRMRYLPYVGLPNILLERFVVPELLQQDATPEKIAQATLHFIADKAEAEKVKEAFTQLHLQLRQDAAEKAAQAVLQYL